MSAPKAVTAPSTPARRPVQISSAGLRGRTNITNGVCGWSGRSTTIVPGSSKPVRYRMSLSWRNLKVTSPLRVRSGGDDRISAAARAQQLRQTRASFSMKLRAHW